MKLSFSKINLNKIRIFYFLLLANYFDKIKSTSIFYKEWRYQTILRFILALNQVLSSQMRIQEYIYVKKSAKTLYTRS